MLTPYCCATTNRLSSSLCTSLFLFSCCGHACNLFIISWWDIHDHSNCFPLDDYKWWVPTGHEDGNNRKKKHRNWWCAACGGQYQWRAPNRILVVQIGVNAKKAKVFKAHETRLRLCDNLINALSLPRVKWTKAGRIWLNEWRRKV